MSSNKTIAKNAVALYFRMFITMLVGLYTSRVILQTLGVEDYGIYNVVGGFVSMFSLISSSLQGAVSRFLTFELGKGNIEQLKTVFSTSFIVMFCLALLVLVATETIGLWYLYNKMVIPKYRLDAAFWCFQFSIASFVLNLLSTPYSSSIISHERMDIYAYMSIIDVVLKLLICYALIVSPIDNLIFYSFLLFVVSMVNQMIYWIFCKRRFEECAFAIVFEMKLLKQMFSFAGWSFIGSSASVLRFQGGNLLLNAFGGPVLNAANGIANTVCSIVSSFAGNFTQAFNPQITKRYASGEFDSLITLLMCASKFSFYLMFVLSLPLMLNAHFLLQLWLGVVPENSVVFTRLILIFTLLESFSLPIITFKSATGRIKNYQITIGGIILLVLPLAYFCLKTGLSVECVPIINIVISIIAFFVRMYMINGDIPNWSSMIFVKKIFLRAIIVCLISSVIPIILYVIIPYGWYNFLLTSLLSIICCLVTIFFVGCDRDERLFVITNIKCLINNKKICVKCFGRTCK